MLNLQLLCHLLNLTRMKNVFKIIGGVILAAVVIVGLGYGFGWIGVHQTKTIGKAHKNAQREVYEQTQSYVQGKKQEALKFYKEYQSADPESKQAIKQMASHSFSEFDETKLDGRVRSFIEMCKYNE